MIQLPYLEPTFEVSELDASDVSGLDVGKSVQGIINYEVIEKTKSYAVLKVKHFSATPSKRQL